MQTCTCDIRLGGDPGLQVRRTDVSVAEIMVLRAIHGDDSVINVIGHAGERRNALEERTRLRQFYSARTEDGRSVVDALFPGAMPQLPTKLSEIGLDDGDVKTTVGKKRKTAEALAAVAGGGDNGGDDPQE